VNSGPQPWRCEGQGWQTLICAASSQQLPLAPGALARRVEDLLGKRRVYSRVRQTRITRMSGWPWTGPAAGSGEEVGDGVRAHRAIGRNRSLHAGQREMIALCVNGHPPCARWSVAQWRAAVNRSETASGRLFYSEVNWECQTVFVGPDLARRGRQRG